MRPHHNFLKILFSIMLSIMGSIQTWGNTTTYYAKARANIATSSTGSGKVYASATQTNNPTYGNGNTASNNQNNNQNFTFYMYAQAEDGSEFTGWSTSNTGTEIANSNSNPYQYSVNSSAERENNATINNLYAVFKLLPTFYFSATAVVTPAGAGTASVSPETTNVRGEHWNSTSATTTATFTAIPNSDYGFIGWSETANGTIVSTANPYNLTLTSTSTDSGSPTNTTLYARFQPYATSITASPSELTAYVGQASSPITHTVAPSGAYDEHTTYESADPTIATVDASGRVTGVATGTTTITVRSLKDDNYTVAAFTTVTVTVKNRVATPVISFETGNDGATATITCATSDSKIYYTKNGGTPTTEDSEYSTPIPVEEGDVIRAIAVKYPADPNWDNSDEAIDTYNSCTTDAPEITFEGDSSTGKATVTITAKTGETIYYTYGNSPADPTPSSYDGTGTTTATISNVSAGSIVKAIAKSSSCQPSNVESKEISFSYADGGSVVIDDREDHKWTYYSGVDASVDGGNYNTNYAGKMYSPNPRNVKITYNGVNGIEGSTTEVKVSVESGETQNKFVYYKTLEQGSTTGEYPYQVISNPFSVRPSTGSGNSKVYYGFAGWKIVSGGDYIKGKSNGDVLSLDENIVFENLPYPSVNCTSAEIVFETTWTQATVVNGSSISLTNLSSSGTYETNFFVLTGAYTTAWTGNKNVTVTSVYPDGSSDARANNVYTRLNVTVNSGYTIKYEYIYINNDNTTLSMGTGAKTLYIGRGVSNTTANGVVCNLIQGYGDSNITGGLGYTLKIESGIYNNLSYIKGYDGAQTNYTVTGAVAIKGVLGCDYDRANNDNSKLKIQNNIAMGSGSQVLLQSTTAGQEVLNVTFKSGSLNSSMTNAGTADMSQSFYIGIAGTYSAGYRVFTMEGGEMWSLAAGLCNNTATTNSVRFRIKGGLIKGSIYGSAANANSYGYKQMILTGGTVRGWIAGGGNGTSANGGTTTGSSYVYVGGNCRVDSEGSTTKINSSLGGNVFGSGSGVENTTTWGEMLYGSNVVLADDAYVERNVFGGGNFGWTDQYATIYLTGGKMSVGNVYGGANQNKGDNVKIYMTGGTVRDGLYGGSNTAGTINYNVEMHINGGSVGQGSAGNGIFGGGYGSSTVVSGNVELTLGVEGQTTSGVTVNGDVYGGSALGEVNGTSGNNTYHTYVTLNKGTINGSLYGGGLGAAGTAADVNGAVQVIVNGGSVRKTDTDGSNGSGGVYGANNINGAPQHSVTVDIYGTDPAPSDNEYALFAVYGGGNKADYTYGNGFPQVSVHDCGNSIEYVYGGGNAAAVASTDVTIYGGNKIGNVFGGGNGISGTAADVNGNTNVKIYGGTIGSVFGGSNSKGTIGGTINVTVQKQTETGYSACAMHIGEVYGGGNMAASDAGNITIGCTGAQGEGIGDLYGGAKNANISGDISLSITGGSIDRVFGGNNVGGSITGGIQIDVDWKTGSDKCDYDYLGSVFGAGNLAQYSIPSGKTLAVNIKNGTVSGNVYGGGKGDAGDHTKGQVTGNPVVTIGDAENLNDDDVQAIVEGDVYGGGDAGNVVGTPVVNVINKCNTTIRGDVYGGGNAADVSGTDVNIDGGNIHDVYGGGHGDKATLGAGHSDKEANVSGDVSVTITGGTINRVFAGSNTNGTISGTNNTLSINKSTTAACDMKIREVYGGGNLAAGNATSISVVCTGPIVEGSNGHAAHPENIGTTLEGIGAIYGGANNADIGTSSVPSDIELNINSGMVANVFGGNNNGGTIYGDIEVNIEKTSDDCGWYVGNVFGGGNVAAYSGSPTVTLTNGTVSHSVYGGGNEAGVGGSTVNINGGQVVDGIYGGCNSSGTVTGAIAVNIKGGTLGTSSTSMTSGIFGGGYGSSTATEGNVTVTIGDLAGTKTPTIYADIYGGSALGNVNGAASDITKVDFLNGTLHGNIYGGGLGRQAVEDDPNTTDIDESVSAVAAKVYGQVQVNIGNTSQTEQQCKIDLRDARIYGCNNTNGSPQDDVEIHIYKTAHDAKNAATYTADDATYAIDQVFGGGNEADYSPASGKKAKVYVYGCDNTIRRVFGGGNAAAASTGVATEINGGRFDYIFGGGNGEDGVAANIGAGGASLTVHSGIINHLFGGSNTLGTITGPMNVSVDHDNTSCTEQIKEFFGGGNLAVIGDEDNPVTLTTTIACGTVFDAVYGGSNLADIYGDVILTIQGGTIGAVYGGSKGVGAGDTTYPDGKAANIYGSTTLNIEAGAIGSAFGGSNINGNITGSITVNLEWDDSNDCAQKSIDYIYGASNLAPYTPTTPSASPAVNIIHGTVAHSVFGGGKGATAIVTSNPVVTIGDNVAAHKAVVTENVYGGGDAAAVTGSTTVTYNDNNASSTVAKLFGGGNAAAVSGSTAVTLTNGKVTGGVYGGCNASGSVGAVTVALNGGTVGAANATADVYGGGFGENTTTTDNITVTLGNTTVYGDIYGGSALGKVNSSTANPANLTTVTITGTNLHGSVFGGGKGDANTQAVSYGNATVNINAANAYTGIYGGANVNGLVSGNIQLNINANIGASGNGNSLDVFGGGYGAATQTGGNVTVNVGDGSNNPAIYGAIYGGSALGSVNDAEADNTIVNVLSGTVNGNIYGGGLGEANEVDGNGEITTDNSAKGQVNGTVTVNIGATDGAQTPTYTGNATINGSVYGCNNTNGSPKGDVTVNVYGTAHNTTNDVDYTMDDGTNGVPTYAIEEVFGGGNLANYSPVLDINEGTRSSKRAIVHIYSCANTIRRVFGGGNAAAAYGVRTIIDGGRFDRVFGGGNGEVTPANIGAGGTDLNVHGGNISQLYGGSNTSGTISGSMGISVDATGACAADMYIAEFFCGSNEADISSSINATIGCGTHFGDVYGGCNLANVTGSVTLTIVGGEMNNVYGGSKGSNSKPADISGDVTLNIHGGLIHYDAFGGSNIKGDINGKITVNMDWSQVSDDCDDPSNLHVRNVYGASNLAKYKPTTPGSYPEVNIWSGTVSGNVFGGGLGETAIVTSNPTVTIGDVREGHEAYVAKVEGNVYGGGDEAAVSGSTTVNLQQEHSLVEGFLFGGGNNAHVTGAVTVLLSGGSVAEDVYGGGALAQTNTSYAAGSSPANTYVTSVTLAGATVTGSVYGGGLGQLAVDDDPNTTDVDESVPAVAANVNGPVTVTVTSGSAANVFGCNNLNGAPQSTVNVNINGGTFSGSVYGGGDLAAYSAGETLTVTMSAGTVANDVFGGGLGSSAAVTGNTSVTVSGGTVTRDVYGGGSEARTNGGTSVTLSGTGAVGNDVYGGGKLAAVTGAVTVALNGGTVARDVYGGGALAETNTVEVSTGVYPATSVTLAGATVTGDVYGGGLGRQAVEDDPNTTDVDESVSAVAANVYGPVTVTTAGTTGSAANVFGCNNLNGAPQSTVAVNIGGGTITNSVYGGGNQAKYSYADAAHPLTVTMTGGTVNKNLFGGGLSADVAGGVSVTISGGTVVGDVYGGGALANTNTANWNPNSGSTTYKLQVYGLSVGDNVTGYYTKAADTYTLIETPGTIAAANTTYYKQTDNYVPVPSNQITVGTTPVDGFYVKSGNNYVAATPGTAVAGVTYYQKTSSSYSPVTNIEAGVTVVTGYYTKTPGTYSPATGTAVAGVKYYEEKTRTGEWATGMTDPSTGATTYKTSVYLIGGTIGNAYGGGLGRQAKAAVGTEPAVTAVEAMVYGDVTVTVGKNKEGSLVGATAFTKVKDETASTASGSNVYTTGHLYGANNINGTPTGNVTVNVFKTRHWDHEGHVSGKDNNLNFEIQGVYGGGNLADYVPADGKKTSVNIDGCEDVSIEFVYGGGNAASVPGTNVLIKACWEVGSAFGGGNGNDKIQDPDTGNWDYKGADVNGDTHISLLGGTIHWAFGGSNRMGDCTGDIYYDITPSTEEGACPLRITTLYGAGSNADVTGDLNLVIKCPTEAESSIENVYAGSFNANIDGSVTMTIIGGNYQNVYGGNNQSGRITGAITLNIQEASGCQPVIIDKLYGGGNLAHYPQNNGSGGYITINVKSCTRIGAIYGGGNQADVFGDTEVNVNMVHGRWAEDFTNEVTSIPRDNMDLSKTDAEIKEDITTEIPNITVESISRANKTASIKVKPEIGTIGDIYGGGDKGDIHGNAVVNIGTATTVDINTYDDDNNVTGSSTKKVLGAHITGNVYGGGYQGSVTGETFVNIGVTGGVTGLTPVMAGEPAAPTGAYTFTSQDFSDAGNDFEGISIKGTDWQYGVFGGGNKGNVGGDSHVYLGVGSVMQSIYGGGCEADVKGNTYVTMLDGYVDDGVYGGGLKGSVGTFTRDNTGHTSHTDCVGGKPDKWERKTGDGKTSTTSATGKNTGTCTVVISGGQVGPTAAANNGMNAAEIVDLGFVFGAGRGEVENPATDADADYHCYVYDTDVTINGTALIMASVYGGGENGRVRTNTLVNIAGGQIGCGNGESGAYDETKWIDPITTSVTEGSGEGSGGTALAECSYWPYGRAVGSTIVYEPFDPYADQAGDPYYGGSTDNPSDGKTYYGSVFGGGSGYYPYVKAMSGETVTDYDWLPSAGWVEGNTTVNITGGHILTNVYGGNELTNVGIPGDATTGKCTVNMSGGTLGVPRTMDQIALHPVTCYLFGAGKGDQRAHFNTWTYVNSVEVNVTGGIIYGSVFGGGEEGNVLGNTEVNISKGANFTVGGKTYTNGPIIGTWGTSYVDGNVFGGGRGFSGESLLGGNVGGDVAVNISGGTMLGSIYGGGRLGSVGYGLYESGDPKIGVMQDDNVDDAGNTVTGFSRGHVEITISGGTIGNPYEFIMPNSTNTPETIKETDISKWTTTSNGDWDKWKTYNHVPNTDYSPSNGGLIHTKGGNVYAGAMGRRTNLAGEEITNWQKLGNVKSTKLTISGSAAIMGNVYGGGEFGAVTGIHTRSEKDYGTEISITGGTIGTAVGTGDDLYYYGSVFGGGMGDGTYGGGDVNKHTNVSIETGADVKKDVYGGGEFGHVGENVVVDMTGGSVGNNLYGGGAYADTNTSNWNSTSGTWADGKNSASSTTYVHLTGGKIEHDAYGGALGQWGVDTRAPKVYGDILVDLNGKEPSPRQTEQISSSAKGCILERVFGCNDQNGSPKGHARVHVHATQNSSTATIRDKIGPIRYSQGESEGYIHYLNFLINETKVNSAYKPGIDGDVVGAAAALIDGKDPNDSEVEAALTDEQKAALKTAAENVIKELEKTHDYDVLAVYGGGDLAEYNPANTDDEYCEVIIDGCQETSIKQVYGGSNAASAPATLVRVNSVYVIDELFGGGNGLDNYLMNGKYYENPGANVGYHNYTHYVTDGTQGDGESATPYKAIDNVNAYTKDQRKTKYGYGSGIANSEIAGGRIHYAYGGSNFKGNIATTSLSVYENMDDSCPLKVDETYGAGKDAQQDGDIDMSMDCVKEMEEIFGGAKNADVNADVTLNITNGSHFKRVFGGNNTSGAIAGYITVNIQESGCEPIIIEELYAGGYLAPYSIYGYKKDGNGNYETPENPTYPAERIALTEETFATYTNGFEDNMNNDLRTLLGDDYASATSDDIEDALEDALAGNDSDKRLAAMDYIACKEVLTSYPLKDPLVNIISATRIDNVYGGGYQALVVGSPHINVNMTTGKMEVKETSTPGTYVDVNNVQYTSGITSETVLGKTRYYVTLPLGSIGNIYGGGNQADIVGDTYVEIGTGKWVNRDEKWETEDASGNIYTYEDKTNGKSKWNEDLTTGDWKWYKVDDASDAGTTTAPTARNAAEIKTSGNRAGEGIVYGGGNQADVTGNTYVIMANGNVENRIYGGGKEGHVGEFNLTNLKPSSLKTANTGVSNVTISGGVVGPTGSPVMVPSDPTFDKGHVFGAGRGPNPSADASNNNEAFVYDANVTISGTALVKASVYGGSENGHVLHNTHVVIEGGQIGIGKNATGAYNESIFASNTPPSQDINGETVYDDLECNSWPYGEDLDRDGVKETHATYDPYARYDGYYDEEKTKSANGGRSTGSNGHTFYGCVFGGGSGYYPYLGADGTSHWVEHAGEVEGNTLVEIKGGHILTNVYGANELTNVKGKSTVKMSGGTVGVPRTVAQAMAHPLTCYIFGAGKGDKRNMFSLSTNVNETEVEISGGKIFGSIFGGGEDGHVTGNTQVTVKGTSFIGTTGTSYVDGNVFGGGRGFSGENILAGCVHGNVNIDIIGGTMLGSIYGGGRLASVGTNSIIDENNAFFGQLTDDVDDDPDTADDETETYGHVTINISGGTIGNDMEDKFYASNVDTDGKTDAQIKAERAAELKPWQARDGIPNTQFTFDEEKGFYVVSHTTGGNVFGGSMGRLTLLDGQTTNPLWPKLGTTKTSTVNISGNATIKGNVYGGPEFGMVRGDAHVTIGGVLGNTNTTVDRTDSDAPNLKRNVFGGGYGSESTEVTTISAGGFGSAITYSFTPMQLAGIVCGDTYVNIAGGHVQRNVYGGGEMATVGLVDYANAERHGDHTGTVGGADEKLYGFALSWPYKLGFRYHDQAHQNVIGGTTHVNITGGRLGVTGKDFFGPYDSNGQPLDVKNHNEVLDPDNAADNAIIKAARLDNGDVFGAGKGVAGTRYDYAFSANVKKSIVNIEYPATNAATPENYKDTDNTTGEYLYDCIAGSVYAGGENGHVIEDAEVTLKNGLVGHAVYGGGKGKDTYHKTGLLKLDESGTFDTDIYSISAGKVYGNTKVTVEDGYVVRNVYGGGNMASVGKGNYASGSDDYYPAGYGETLNYPDSYLDYKDDAGAAVSDQNRKLWEHSNGFDPSEPISSSNTPTTMADYFLSSGKTEVKILGGQIGYVNTSKIDDTMKDGLPYGNVFGGCRGEAAPNITESPRYLYCPQFYSGYVNETKVIIGDANGGPRIYGSVYGGGQDGHVRRDTYVEVNDGEIGLAFSGTDLETGDGARTNQAILGGLQDNNGVDNPQWLHRGNVYGSGSGISKYEFDFNHDGDTDDTRDDNITYHGNGVNEQDYSTSAGSVTRFTQVDIKGGTIHRNVYGGGSLASVGPPPIPPTRTEMAYKSGTTKRDDAYGGDTIGQGWWSQCTVNVSGTVGSTVGYDEKFGGEVYGASRGEKNVIKTESDANNFATTVWTKVHIKNGAVVMGNVFGGGDAGKVKKDTDVIIGDEKVTP